MVSKKYYNLKRLSNLGLYNFILGTRESGKQWIIDRYRKSIDKLLKEVKNEK